MNKKGFKFLTEKTLEIVLAVLGITFLIILGSNLLNLFFKDQTLKYAESNLDSIQNIINSNIIEMNSNENTKEIKNIDFLIQNPKNWWFFITTEKNENPPLAQCKDSFCICICPEKFVCSKNEAGTQKITGACFPFSYNDYVLSSDFEALLIPSEGIQIQITFNSATKKITINKK
jgi:hypothetical protein